jgi:hypothetical protein
MVRLTRRALVAAAAAGTAGCLVGSGSRGGASFAGADELWTQPFYRSAPRATWVGRWPNRDRVPKRWERDMPVNLFSDEEFGNRGVLPCGQLEYLSFADPVNLLLDGAVVVARAPAPGYDPLASGWKAVGRASSGVTQFQLTTVAYGPEPARTLVLLAFPDRTLLFTSGAIPSRQIAEAFASRSTPPPPLPLPPNAVIAERSRSLPEDVFGPYLGMRGAGQTHSAFLYQAPPGVDAPLVMRLELYSSTVQESTAEFVRQLPSIRAQFGAIEREDRSRKPWNHLLATLSDVHAEGSDVVITGAFPAEHYAYYFGGPYPRG